jgi:hypothetical protein
VDLHIHSPIRLHGVALNKLRIRTTLLLIAVILDPVVLDRIHTEFGRVHSDMDWSARVCIG